MRKLILTILAGALLTSCESSEELTLKEFSQASFNTASPCIMLTTVDATKEVSLDNIYQISDFINSDKSAFKFSKKCIKDIYPIKDSEDTIRMYIVNYENNEGFLVISASKEYCPILAYNEVGSFKIENLEDSGVSIWIEEQVESIKHVGSFPDSCRLAWKSEWEKM